MKRSHVDSVPQFHVKRLPSISLDTIFQIISSLNHDMIFRRGFRPLRSIMDHSGTSAGAGSRRSISTSSAAPPLLTPAQFHSLLAPSSSQRPIPLCATWFLPSPTSPPNQAHSTFLNAHIPGARYFDLDAVSDSDSPYPHMLPSAATFASAMSALNIKPSDHVVVYDSREQGLFSAPRVAWTLRVFGHTKVSVLDNFRLWCEQDLPTTDAIDEAAPPTDYPNREPNGSMVMTFSELHGLVQQGAIGTTVQVLDARPAARFSGAAPEPRAGLRSGHMPGSISVPFSVLLDGERKTLLPRQELRRIFEERGVRQDIPIVSSCGSGVTAAVLDLALEVAGWGTGQRKVYDGSWS